MNRRKKKRLKHKNIPFTLNWFVWPENAWQDNTNVHHPFLLRDFHNRRQIQTFTQNRLATYLSKMQIIHFYSREWKQKQTHKWLIQFGSRHNRRHSMLSESESRVHKNVEMKFKPFYLNAFFPICMHNYTPRLWSRSTRRPLVKREIKSNLTKEKVKKCYIFIGLTWFCMQRKTER